MCALEKTEAETAKAVKPSFYNFSRRIGSDRYLILNPISGAVDLLYEEAAGFLHDLAIMKNRQQTSLQEYLENRGYITRASKEEEFDVLKHICENADSE